MKEYKPVTIEIELDVTTIAWYALEAHKNDQKMNDYIVDTIIKYAQEMDEKDNSFSDPDYRPSSRG